MSPLTIHLISSLGEPICALIALYTTCCFTRLTQVDNGYVYVVQATPRQAFNLLIFLLRYKLAMT